jgi:HEAT repeat protein
MFALAAIGTGATDALPFLLRRLRTKTLSLDQRLDSASVIIAIAPKQEDVLPTFLEALDASPRGRWVMEALSDMGERARPALPRLRSLLTSEDCEARAHSARAIGLIAPEERREMIALLVRLLNTSHHPDRELLKAIAAFGRDAKAATPRLVELLDTDDDFERMIAARTLTKVNPREIAGVKTAVSVLHDHTSPAREEAIDVLVLAAATFPQSLHVVRDALSDQDDLVRQRAARALTQRAYEHARTSGPCCWRIESRERARQWRHLFRFHR